MELNSHVGQALPAVKTNHVICQCIVYAMVKVGNAHPTLWV